MKQYKNINELLDYIMSKGVIVTNKDDALKIFLLWSNKKLYKNDFMKSRKYL